MINPRTALGLLLALALPASALQADGEINFNKDIRQLLSNRCYKCHGPDDAGRKAGLRFDKREGALAELESGSPAIVPGKPDASELIRRLKSTDADERMPPVGSGDPLTPAEIKRFEQWVTEGAKYAQHWSYTKPVRPPVPDIPLLVKNTNQPSELADWPKNNIDRFLLARLIAEGVQPMPEADRYTLIRRLALDLTGLPPSSEEVKQFIEDKSPNAYETLVDRLMAKQTYGEHWARKWLDLARYADSSGYADDPPRTIWAYRDYVIRSINDNKPFDQFTIEQIAGDLLPNPTDEQLVATAFNRNTLTNNEGGTNDEEFRNVAIVDRVNTTMAVWMGTTIDCAQCHTHKFDPISQTEYFQMFAFFNSTQDADRRDESPLISIYTEQQLQNKADWETRVTELEKTLSTPTPQLLAARQAWEKSFDAEPNWSALKPGSASGSSGAKLAVDPTGGVTATKGGKTETYTVSVSASGTLSALQLQMLPADSLPGKGAGHGDGNFVVSRITASIVPPNGTRQTGRFVRIDLPGKGKMMSLAEVQVFNGAENVAVAGKAKQSSTDFEGPAKLAIDGNTNGHYTVAKSTTHTAVSDNPWWELDLEATTPIDRVVIWNRTDSNLQPRLNGAILKVLDEQRNVVFEQTIKTAPKLSAEFPLSNVKPVPFVAAFADYSQPQFSAASVIDNQDAASKGWSVGGSIDKPHQLTLITAAPVKIPDGSKLEVSIAQLSKHEHHTLGSFRLATTDDTNIVAFAQTPSEILSLIKSAKRTEQQDSKLTEYFLSNVAAELKPARDELASLKKQLAALKPATSVPVMRDMPGTGRVTKIQLRGNYQITSDTVTQGVPAAFHQLPKGAPMNRLSLAKWLVDENNPLTSRVIANRYWEAIFGIGIVSTSEEFGSQGELPFHPELLEYLATELTTAKWNTKALIKQLVMSAAYRQSSRVTDELLELDPSNRLLARGPRFRLSAEMIRDQALAVSGLLSPKMYGAPVRPPQPSTGLTAAFGSAIDWKTSTGEDKFRRGLYTMWRRSNPYPSMIAFDATNREVCTIRRDRTNTPLQALVTLNDPVFIEAAQALGRQIAVQAGSVDDQVKFGFERTTSRPPKDFEQARLVKLFEAAKSHFAKNPDAAMKLATMPIGPIPKDGNAVDLAAWTLVGNVLLNMDELFMKR